MPTADESSAAAQRPAPRVRPHGVGDATVEATGKLSEAFEYVERARGHLFSFHQLMGHADLQFGEAADLLREAGHGDVADAVELEVVGRNTIDGRWTFQMVEEFDAHYHRPVGDHVRRVESELVDGIPHLFESEMKERRRSVGRAGHEARPPRAHTDGVETIGD